ncbi:F-box protein, partial [Salmonella enterica]|uniref:F-box protein n=1 Tax=Salmonella enterica TaxID=28901 RepID=UPI003D292C9A
MNRELFSSLPEDVVRELFSWLMYDDQINFVRCSQGLHRYQKELIRVRLHLDDLQKIIDNPRYRAKILSMVRDPGQQLQVSL